MNMINVNHLEENQYFCEVIFDNSYQLSHMNHVELSLKIVSQVGMNFLIFIKLR